MYMLVDSAVTVPVNIAPLIDDGDFKTIESSVVYNAAGLTLVWNFVTPAGVQTQTAVTPTNTGGVYDWTNVGNGMYKIEIPASGGGTINNDTEGYGWFSGVATGVLPWIGPIITFAPANVVNSLVTGSDVLDVSMTQILGTAVSSPATAGVLDVNVKNINNTAAATPGASGGILISGSNSGTTTLGALTVTGATTLTGAVSLGSTLGVTGTTTLAAVNTGAIGTGNVTITGTLSTSGTATFNALTVTNAFTVSGATTFTGAISGTNASNDIRGILLQATQTGVTIPTVTTVTNQLTAAAIATGVWQDTTAGDFTVASSIGKSLYTTGNAPGAASGLAIVGSDMGAVTSVSGAVGSVTGNVGGNVTGSVGSVVGAVGSVTGNVGGNVVGSVASVVGAVGSVAAGGITAASIADGAIDRATFAADTGLQPIRSNTAQAGAGTTITLDASASAVDSFYVNDLILLTGGTGVGQARFITAYNGTSKVATVSTWSTNPDNTTTFAILPFDSIPGATAPTAAQVATAVWTDLLAGSDFSTVASIGKLLKDDIDAAISTRLAPTTSGRTLDVTATGGAGIDWSNVENPTTTLALTGTTIATTQKVDVETIKTNPVVNGGTITFPTGATLASTTNITAGTITTVSGNVTGSVGSIATGGIAAASFAAGAIDAAALAADAVAEIWAYVGSGATTAFTMLANTYNATVSSANGSVNDAAATTTSFKTTLTEVSNFWNDALLVFTSGALTGQSRPITTYTQTNGVITFDEALTSAPANGVTFVIQAAHIHPVSQIATGIWQDTTAGDFTVSSSIGKSLYTSGNSPGASSGLALVGSNMGTVSSVSGAVGSVTGNVGGNVVGSVASVTGNVGGNVVGNVVGSVASVSGAVGSVTGSVGSVTGLTNATIASAVHTTAMTESYNTDGSAATLAQACYVMMQMMTEISFSSTTATVKKLDGSTTAFTLTINDASTPTSITRST